MTTHNKTPFAPIWARVGDAALGKVTRMFAGSLDDIFTELLQNSRRAGASRVDVTVQPIGDEVEITIADDGAGISDPAILLSFGDSRWDNEIAHNEDPAGMGILALAQSGCSVDWETSSGRYRLVLAPEHFLGREAATVVSVPTMSGRAGTTITFKQQRTRCGHVIERLERAVTFFPLPVVVNGVDVEQREFLANAVHIEEWAGLRLGVGAAHIYGLESKRLNFFGRTVGARLPIVVTLNRTAWCVMVDVVSCPELELVLPARKELVQTEFLEDLYQEAQAVIFRAMAKADPAPEVAWRDWQTAAQLGISMPIPRPRLRRWEPLIADIDLMNSGVLTELEGLDRQDIALMKKTDDPPIEQCLIRALSFAETPPSLFARDDRLQGYAWYDRFDRVLDVSLGVVENNDIIPAEAYIVDEELEDGHRVDGLEIHLNIAQADVTDDYGESRNRLMVLPTDVVVEPYVDDEGLFSRAVLITRNTSLTPDTLSEIIVDSYFYPNDELEADSYYTQRHDAEREVWRSATNMLLTKDEADRSAIIDALETHVSWVTGGRDVDIRKRNGRYEVTFPEMEQTAMDTNS